MSFQFRSTLTIARLLVLFAAAFPYLRVLGHGFIALDDQIYTYLNPFLNGRAAGGLWMLWRSPYIGLYIPVANTAWALVHLLEGGGATWDPLAFHLANLLLHAFNAVLAFELLRCLLLSFPLSPPRRIVAGPPGQSSLRRSPRHSVLDGKGERQIVTAAALGALFFALHPLHVEPVAWITGLKDLLCGTFSLLFLLFFLKSDTERAFTCPPRFIGSLAFLTLAILSKPTGVMLPALGLTLAFCVTEHAKWRLWVLRAGTAALPVALPGIVVTAGVSFPSG